MPIYSIDGKLTVWIRGYEVEAEDAAEARDLAISAGTSVIEPSTAEYSELEVYDVEDVSDDYGDDDDR